MKKLTPIKAIRMYCLGCCAGSSFEVKNCIIPDCSLLSLRFGKRAKGISALKMIRKKCLNCGEGTAFDVKNCEINECSLYYYRFGKNPNLKDKRGKGNPDALKKYRLIQRNSPKQVIVEADANPKL